MKYSEIIIADCIKRKRVQLYNATAAAAADDDDDDLDDENDDGNEHEDYFDDHMAVMMMMMIMIIYIYIYIHIFSLLLTSDIQSRITKRKIYYTQKLQVIMRKHENIVLQLFIQKKWLWTGATRDEVHILEGLHLSVVFLCQSCVTCNRVWPTFINVVHYSQRG